MPGLLIKDLPPVPHARLKERASLHRRSLSGEALTILDEALSAGAGPPSLEEVRRLRVVGRGLLTEEMLDEARHTGRP